MSCLHCRCWPTASRPPSGRDGDACARAATISTLAAMGLRTRPSRISLADNFAKLGCAPEFQVAEGNVAQVRPKLHLRHPRRSSSGRENRQTHWNTHFHTTSDQKQST
jgi:hypothetical protein